MFPFLINHGDVQLPTFFFMIMVASLAATFYSYWRAPAKGMSQIAVLDISLFGTLAGVIGARVLHIIAEYPAYYIADPIRVFYFWQGGFVGYGAFFGILISTVVYLRVKKLPILPYVDLMALGCPLIIFMVRVGCVGAGCCYGKPTDFPIHLIFNNPASDAGRDFPGIALHATQIYDMINAMINFGVLYVVDKRKKFHGQIVLLFFMMYALGRFLIEFLRGDSDRGIFFGGLVSTSQIIGILIFLVAIPVYFLLKKKYPVKAQND